MPGAGNPFSRPFSSPYIFVCGREAIRTPAETAEPMLNDVYNSKILELAGNIPRLGRLSDPDASARAHSKLCGSTVTIDLKMDGDDGHGFRP